MDLGYPRPTENGSVVDDLIMEFQSARAISNSKVNPRPSRSGVQARPLFARTEVHPYGFPGGDGGAFLLRPPP